MTLSSDVYNQFRVAFEEKCFRLIMEAYNTSINEKIIQLDWEENDISSEIHRHIEENPLRKSWRVITNIESHISKDIPKVKGFANTFPRIDFRFVAFSKEEEYTYYFEAKRLKQNSSALKRRYIDTGINSFLNNKYENGSLVGYLIEGKIEETITGINSLLIKDRRESETLNHISHKLITSYYESNHASIGTLKHLILDFTSI